MAHRVVILASGAGTLAQSRFDARDLNIDIVAVISDQPEARVLARAHSAGIHTELVPVAGSRQLWNAELLKGEALPRLT